MSRGGNSPLDWRSNLNRGIICSFKIKRKLDPAILACVAIEAARARLTGLFSISASALKIKELSGIIFSFPGNEKAGNGRKSIYAVPCYRCEQNLTLSKEGFMKLQMSAVTRKLGAITILGVLAVGASTGLSSGAHDSQARSRTNGAGRANAAPIAEKYGNLPLSFEANDGQADSSVKFISRGNGYVLFLSPTEAVLSLMRRAPGSRDLMGTRSDGLNTRSAANDLVRVKVEKANPNAKITGLGELPGKSNYFRGNDPAKWRTGISNYSKIKMEDIYPGIDLIYYGNQRQLEYDWIVNPGADPKAIRFEVESRAGLEIDSQGNLILSENGEARLNKPFIYQQRDGSCTEIKGKYVLLGKREVGFHLEKYDRSLPLVIDPILRYSTYLGGSDIDWGNALTIDSSGNAYIIGFTGSANFPLANPLQAYTDEYFDVFIAKLNSSGNALIYSTFLGGSNGTDYGYGIAVDSSGNAYIAGDTVSDDFPIQNAIQARKSSVIGSDAFVAKLNASGNQLIYSTYLGGNGNDTAWGIAVDSSGNAYVTGFTNSTNYPTASPFQATHGGGAFDVFISKLNAAGNALVYSTYLGGSGEEFAHGIALDSSGYIYIVGETRSPNFPLVNSFQQSNSGVYDVFVTKMNSAGSALVYSTLFGGNDYDTGHGIALDSAGNAYVTGFTNSSNFPTKNPIQAVYGGNQDAYVSKIDPTGSILVYSTYLGGSQIEDGAGIGVDSSGNCFVTGATASTNFPVANALQASYGGGTKDAFVSELNASGNAFVYSTFLGGNGEDYAQAIAVSPSGSVYVTGYTASTNFPTLNPLQSSYRGGEDDAFVLKIGSLNSAGDVDGDGRADVSIWRRDSGIWYVLSSNSPGSYITFHWGISSDTPVSGDYDGDGKADIAVWRPVSGTWYLLPSGNSGSYLARQWGMDGDIPVPGDFDGDGKTDLAVWRPDTGIWYILPSSSPGTFTAVPWGISSDIPVPGDYDGDGKTDIAVWRPDEGIWYVLRSNFPGSYTSIHWGMPGDIPVPADYDGDHKIDIAVQRPTNGVWYILSSVNPGTYSATQWGLNDDVPVSSDFDGDGKSDIAVWRLNNGVWYALSSSVPGTYRAIQWGLGTDEPISPFTGILRAIH
jgi:hypothetical protein